MDNLVNHLNVPDKNGDVYCRATNGKLSFLNMAKVRQRCFNCKMFAGTYQGLGVECVWEDADAESPSIVATSATAEYNRANKKLPTSNYNYKDGR